MNILRRSSACRQLHRSISLCFREPCQQISFCSWSQMLAEQLKVGGAAIGRQSMRGGDCVRGMATIGGGKGRGIPKVDIGARARSNQKRRLWIYALSMSAVSGFIIVVLGSFQDQLVFYVTPTDAMEKFSRDPTKNKYRLGGLVVEGSVMQPASSTETEFVVTDLVTDMLVRSKGALPDLFREGHSVVVEGFIRPWSSEASSSSSARPVTEKARASGFYFSAIEVLAKHDEKYMPKEVAAAIEKNRAAIEAAHSPSQEQLQS
ncbi:hypothetical protein SUGI_0744270 [Cryptomeria japonica]|nr:cytochrome c-type biogenesis protein CcmE homolog, mitochondrial [Cryptomeria japonica]XP_057849284.1 cytochrome c-type biogenesis protein CcmE homolog, mitochondrial [Cryptomeria japonica]XP_057849285.1 cytochrome c-type biogenesis protein CcmE homolog, mitochondrial [Cryptomeria japonica]GLJ36854.1 hypothetical protein SUGI_0744270 [Cryptomeria japonica]